MYLAVIILPLLGSIASGFFGRKVGVSGAQLITTACVSITTMFAILMFTEITFNDASVYISVCRWLELASINLLWGFNFDFLTVSMLIPVLVISCLVHIYSIGYMSGDPHNQRFFSYLSLFTFMMIILVTSNNFLLMFVGWEGVGICSYLLVNFWFTRIAANQSSISALLTNRVGDCFLTIGMFIMLLSYGNIDYTTVFSLAPFIGEKMITFASVCLLIGAMAKSSQIGLHVWLPLAMEGPTPVSALIHAATMVTAGVYLLIRTSPLLEYSSTALLACLWIGSVTTVFSSVVGLFQQDIKKVIAYSTMSQLGMMVIAIGLSCYNLALFHLVNHAFYKGLLFLAAGAVIHAVADNQDFRKYGGLILFLPLTYTVMLIASLSLVAFPFMTGFYSKDFILESCFSQFTYSSIAVYFTAVIGAIFTTLYSVKVLYLTFMASPNAPSITYNKAHESDIYMSLPLIILAIFSVYFGFFTKDIFIGIGSHAYVDNSIFIHPLHEVFISSEFAVPHFFKLLPFFLTITALIVSIIVFETMPRLIIIIKYTRIVYHIFSYFNLKFLVESIYNRFITYFILKVGGQTTKVLDKGFVEMIGPYGLEIFLKSLSNNLNMLNTNVVTTYALYILTAFIFYVCLPYYYKDSFVLFILMCVAVSFAYYLLKQYNSNKNDIIYKSDPIMVVKSGFLDPDTLTNVLIFASATFIGVGLVAASRAVYSSLNNHKDIKGQCDDNSILQKANTVDGDNTIIAEADKLDHYLDTVFYSEYSPVKWIADLGSCREFYVIGGLVIVCIGLWRSYAVFKFNDDINKIAEHSSTNRLQTEHTPDGRSSAVIKDIVDNTYDSQNRFVQGFQRWTEMRVNRVPIEGGLDYDFRIDCQIDDQYVRDFWLWPLPIKVHSHVMSFVELTGYGPDNVRKFSQTIYQIWNPFSGILPDIQWNFGNYVPQWNLPPVPGYFRFYRVAEDWIDIFDQGLVANMDLSFYLASTLWA